MKYLKDYEELNESLLATISAVVFGGLFLRGLFKFLKNYFKSSGEKVYNVIIKIEKAINKASLKDLKIDKIFNGYKINVENVEIEITDEKLIFGGFIILPNDNYFVSESGQKYELGEDVSEKIKIFMRNILDKLNNYEKL